MNLGRETETLEFKKSTGELKEGIISIGAILNKHQKGELYFGVRPDGTPIGQEISEKTLRDISQAISNHIEPQIFPEIQTVRIDGKECILVRFEGYNTPYFAYDVARIRVADEDKVLSQQELVAYLRKQDGAEDAWERRVSNFLVEQVDGKLVERYDDKCKNDPIWLAYNRAYKTHYARYLKKKMTTAQFEQWIVAPLTLRPSAGSPPRESGSYVA